MRYTLHRITFEDGSWQDLMDQWGQLAANYGEDIANYALDAMPVLRDLARAPGPASGVYGLRSEDGRYEAVAQMNSTFLPGYTGKVLRVRHLLLSPRFDFDDNYEVTEYGNVLGSMFAQSVALSRTELPSQHVKFHARSPADRLLFSALQEPVRDLGFYSDVAMKGSWFYLSLQPVGHATEGDTNDGQA